MEYRKTEPDRVHSKERSNPIPLADRRRLVRPDDKAEPQPQVFTDWASI